MYFFRNAFTFNNNNFHNKFYIFKQLAILDVQIAQILVAVFDV